MSLEAFLEARLARLLALEGSAPLEVDHSAADLASCLVTRIDEALAKLVLETPLRPAVRARPALAERWPLCVCAKPEASTEAQTLRLLWEREQGHRATATDVEFVTEAYALIAAVEHEVSEDRRRIAMAIDAGQPHHALVGGMRDIPKDGLRKRGARAELAVDHGYAQVLAPDCGSIQLHFPLESLNETVLETLRVWRGSKGLRHWAALQRLLSVEGGRSGRVQWKLEEHLDAVGYSDRSREDLAVRNDVAHEVELLTQLELAVYDRHGKLRLRQALLTPITKAEREIDGTGVWALEGLVLEVHPLLYDGVRDPKSGQIGTNWYPQTTELAKIDDVRFPYAISLGLLLPIRWRWAWSEGKRYCALSGANLIRAAGIAYDRRRAARAWLSLRKNLEELQAHSALGHFEWVRDPETLDGVCHLYPPQWAVDRTVHALPPVEIPEAKIPRNGKELREWRKAKGMTQAHLADALGVSVRTVKRAESSDDALSSPLSAKLDALATTSASKRPSARPSPP